MPYLNRNTGQVGQTAQDPVALIGGLEAILKRKVGRSNDFQDQDLSNIKEHFRIVNKGFQQLQVGRKR